MADLGLPQQAGEGVLQTSERDRVSPSRREEDRAVTVGERQLGPVRLVPRECAAQVGADGNQARFEKLGIPDGEEAVPQVDVAVAQAKRFARAEPGGVEHQEHEAERGRLNQGRGMDQLRGRRE